MKWIQLITIFNVVIFQLLELYEFWGDGLLGDKHEMSQE